MERSNPSGIHPMYDKVLVKPREVERTTRGGLMLPDDTIEKAAFGRKDGDLIATGPAAFRIEGWPDDAPRPRPGDRIMFSKYNADEVMGLDGATYWMMKDTAIMAVLAE